MPSRDWLLYAALGLCVVLGAVVGLGIADYTDPVPRVIPYGETAKAKADYEARRRASAPDDAVVWIGRVKRSGQQDAAQQGGDGSDKAENYHNALDLEAQWAAAAAGERMARLAVWQLVFGFVGIGAVAWSLYYTRISIALSRSAVEVANRTADDAHLSAERELRAYVMVETAWLEWELWQPRAHVKIRNFGQTPARDVTHWINCDFGPDVKFDPPEPGEIFQSKSPFGPGGDRNLSTTCDPVDIHEHSEIVKRNTPIYVFGGISYFDAFGERRETVFRLTLPSGPGTSIADIRTLCPCDEGNSYT